MKYCKKCKLSVQTHKTTCPLCFATLTDVPKVEGEDLQTAEKEDTQPSGSYPPGNELSAYRYNFVLRFLFFISIVLISSAVLVNILTYNGSLWFLLILAGILYLWAAIAYPIFAKKSIGHIIVIEALSTSLILYFIQYATNTKGWALEYAMPFIFAGATLFITFIIFLKRMKWRQYTVYQMTMMLLGFIPILFCIFGLVQLIWPSLVSALYSCLTLVGMFVFADKKYENEIIKRFHL